MANFKQLNRVIIHMLSSNDNSNILFNNNFMDNVVKSRLGIQEFAFFEDSLFGSGKMELDDLETMIDLEFKKMNKVFL